MVEKDISPSSINATELLNALWTIVTQEKNSEIDPTIDKLIHSKFVSIRYCLPTQLLGKLLDHRLNCLCLQKGTCDDESLWDPRSFANKVIAPWVSDNQSVLGTSADPYVGKPLRKPFLESDPDNVKGKSEWVLLYDILNEVEENDSEEFTHKRMMQTLRSIYRKCASLIFEYYVPERISLEQTEGLITKYLSEASGGARGLSVAAAFFETVGVFFKLYSEVRRHKINASDKSTGSVADIECMDNEGHLKLAIEVKERNLTLIDAKSGLIKSRKVSLKELLFNAPDIIGSEENELSDVFAKAWASGTNLYRLSIHELIRVGLILTGESGRIAFLKNIGLQVDEYSTQPTDRKRWKDLLEDI